MISRAPHAIVVYSIGVLPFHNVCDLDLYWNHIESLAYQKQLLVYEALIPTREKWDANLNWRKIISTFWWHEKRSLSSYEAWADVCCRMTYWHLSPSPSFHPDTHLGVFTTSMSGAWYTNVYGWRWIIHHFNSQATKGGVEECCLINSSISV